MAYRLRPGIAVVIVKNREGELVYHYARKPGGTNDFGPIIEWLGPEQRHLVGRLVDEIDIDEIDEQSTVPANGVVASVEPLPGRPSDQHVDLANAPSDDSDAVRLCVETLDYLGVPKGAGAPTCRNSLRSSGARFSNSVVAHAVRERRGRSNVPEVVIP